MKFTEDKIKEVQQKHREQMRANRDKVKARKARTHRLIVRGAIAEGAIPGSESMTNEEFQAELFRQLGLDVSETQRYPERLQEEQTLRENPR